MISRSVLVGLALSAIACREPSPPRSPPPAGISSAASLRSTCPLGVRNAHVSYDDTATGAKLTFTASPEHLVELRARVRASSAMHGSGQNAGPGHEGKHGAGGGRHGLKPKYLPPSTASVEDVPEGARATFTPSDPKDLDSIRATLKLRAERMMSRCDE